MELYHPDIVTTFRRHLSFFLLQTIVSSSTVYILDTDPISFWFVTIANCHKLSGIKQHKYTSYNSGGQKSDTDLSGLASGGQLGYDPP